MTTDPTPDARTAALLRAAGDWQRIDPDPSTREELRAVVERADPAELEELMGRRVAFGTAGLRAPLGAGPNRMNRLVVRQAAAGLSRHLLATVPDAATRGVLVGHDARHGSVDFARDVVEVVRAHGIAVHAFREPVPTPLVAFGARHLDTAAAVVLTASHNPAADNGMKVYWEDSAQIVAPVDRAIAAAIDAVAADGEILPTTAAPGPLFPQGGATSDDELVTAYLRDALARSPRGSTDVRVAMTALHGVGAELAERLLRAAGHHDLHPVEQQRRPDPDFPTVAFPNPEEPGALDALLDTARAFDCDLALANDPDADRLAMALPDATGKWRALSGDEIGTLLAQRLLELGDPSQRRLVCTTVVSSRLLSRVAAAAGADFVETLTGFKWLCRPGLAHPECHQVLLYEEALGYAVGPGVRDKDGIAAALVAVDLVAELRREGRTVWDVLDSLAVQHGAHVPMNGSVRLSGPGWQDRVVTLVRALVDDPPTALGGFDVVAVDLPAPDVIRWYLRDDTRVVVRPSGTEPKLKYYCEAIESVTTTAAEARANASQRLRSVVHDLERLLTV
ncbi:MAG: phospho-sugar mutase [Microthrixaceae bacterium]